MKLVFTSRTSPLNIPFTVPVKTFIPLQKSIPRGHLTRSVIGTIHSISTSKSSSCGSCGRK